MRFLQEDILDNTILGATWFEIILATVGGLLIGFSTSFHLTLKGRITGMSGIYRPNIQKYIFKGMISGFNGLGPGGRWKYATLFGIVNYLFIKYSNFRCLLVV